MGAEYIKDQQVSSTAVMLNGPFVDAKNNVSKTNPEINNAFIDTAAVSQHYQTYGNEYANESLVAKDAKQLVEVKLKGILEDLEQAIETKDPTLVSDVMARLDPMFSANPGLKLAFTRNFPQAAQKLDHLQALVTTVENKFTAEQNTYQHNNFKPFSM